MRQKVAIGREAGKRDVEGWNTQSADAGNPGRNERP